MKQGIEINSPRATFQQAYSMKLIDNEQIWLEMMENRNLMSHAYKLPTAKAIYEDCKTYLLIMEKTYNGLKKKYKL